MKSKKALFDLPYSWIFAIVAGCFIILIAIYATTRLVNTETRVENSLSGQQLLNYLDPASNGITSATSPEPIRFKKETRIYFNCSVPNSRFPFGRETLAFTEESGILKKWPEAGEAISRYNKYIFANNFLQGKVFYITAFPFFSGFKVDDLIMIVSSSENYCFVQPPEKIAEDLSGVHFLNINVTSNVNLCAKGSIRVCFEGAYGCNISVSGDCNEDYCTSSYEKGSVTKNGKTVEYFGNLIYAAIFSSNEIYECNIKRLGKKINELANIYDEKIGVIGRAGCSSDISSYLKTIASQAGNLTSSSSLMNIFDEVKAMDDKNCKVDLDCRVYNCES